MTCKCFLPRRKSSAYRFAPVVLQLALGASVLYDKLMRRAMVDAQNDCMRHCERTLLLDVLVSQVINNSYL